LEETQQEIGYDSKAQIIIDESKIKRRFHKCKRSNNYFYFFPEWEKMIRRLVVKALPGKPLAK